MFFACFWHILCSFKSIILLFTISAFVKSQINPSHDKVAVSGKKNILIVLVSFAQASLYSEKCPGCFENRMTFLLWELHQSNWEKLSKQAHSALLLLMKQLSPCFSDTPPFQRSPLCYETQTLLWAAGPEEWSPSDLWPLRSWLLKAELFPALGFL